MGQTIYSSTRSAMRTNLYSNQSRDQIFKEREISNEMSPENLGVREARDSDAHPKSLPIIIGLDETGSMRQVPDSLVRGGLTKVMSGIIDNGIPDPQVLFLGIGDHKCDRAPLQVGQFESGDDLLDKWLTSVYLEGCGGGNDGESYHLAWLVAARHTSCDHIEKRNGKGFLFTVGDEKCHKTLPARLQSKILGGDTTYEDVCASELLAEAQKNWNVYHINVENTAHGKRSDVVGFWKELLGDNLLIAKDESQVASIIASIVTNGIDSNTSASKIQKEDTESAPVAEEVSDPVGDLIG